jgi:hypothetical protein
MNRSLLRPILQLGLAFSMSSLACSRPPQGELRTREDARVLAEEPPRELGEPVIKSTEQRKQSSSNQHVMEMRHYEIRVMQLKIERNRSKHYSREAAQYENKQKTEDKQERRPETQAASSERRDPADLGIAIVGQS